MILGRYLTPLKLPPGVMPAVIAVACIAVGAALYWLIERPFMAMRDKWFPTNFPARSGPQPVVATAP